MENALADLFRLIDTDYSKSLSREEWMQAFDALDADHDGCISRKEWQLKQGQTLIFDTVRHKHFAAIQRKDWESMFQVIDKDGSGAIDLQEWAGASVAVANLAENAQTERAKAVVAPVAEKMPKEENPGLLKTATAPQPINIDVRTVTGQVLASLQVAPTWSGTRVKAAANRQMKSGLVALQEWQDREFRRGPDSRISGPHVIRPFAGFGR
jgi:hypothetical protein